ncbi:hypothetical protein PINS_up008164 [Pythium insidiosum]|nr:hypothetical protein PINS_up008164 [Pythium insidiosum]
MCIADVEYVPQCGHIAQLKCYRRKAIEARSDKYVCAQMVDVNLPRCGHKMRIACANASVLDAWVGTVPNVFGLVEEGVRYGPKDYRCSVKVTFRRRCGHELQLSCEQAFDMALNAPTCSEKMDFIDPECGHTLTTTCHEVCRLKSIVARSQLRAQAVVAIRRVVEGDLSPFLQLGLNNCCIAKVVFVRKCGHEEVMTCREARVPKSSCKVPVEATRPDCGHGCTIPCWLLSQLLSWEPWHGATDDDVNLIRGDGILKDSMKLTQNVPVDLAPWLSSCKGSLLVRRATTCGHDVRMSCEDALQVIMHQKPSTNCSVKVNKVLPCGHEIKMVCSEDSKGIRCSQLVTKACWNHGACQQEVAVKCYMSDRVVQCDSKIEWRCSRGVHAYQLPICKKGVPSACPQCSEAELANEIAATQRLIDNASESPRLEWPPCELPTLLSPHRVITPTVPDQLEFYKRKLTLLQQFEQFVAKAKNVWERPLFLPRYVPVLLVPRKQRRSNAGTIEVCDYASVATWNNVEAREWSHESSSDVQLPGKAVVFAILYTLGVNENPDGVPRGKHGAGHLRWIESQQLQLGYDSAIFVDTHTKKSQGRIVRIWDPHALFPFAEAAITGSDQSHLLSSAVIPTSLGSLSSNPPRFVRYESACAGAAGSDVETSRRKMMPMEIRDRIQRTLGALQYEWARRTSFVYPWTGSELCVSSVTLVESAENRLRQRLHFVLSSSGSKTAPKKTPTPFAGINALRNVESQQPFVEVALLRGLELLEVQKPGVNDAIAALQAYVGTIQHLQQQAHPLLLLALARLVDREKNNNGVKSVELYALFCDLYPEAAQMWLTPKELNDLEPNALPTPPSTSSNDDLSPEQRWQKLKDDHRCSSDAMEKLLKMVGLRQVKRFAINMFKNALAFQAMPASKRKKNVMTLNYCFTGNPGTGKTTVAKLFAELLRDSGMRRKSTTAMCTAQELKDGTPQEFRDTVNKAMGGVVFIDEAYELDPMNDPKGRPIVAELLVAAEDKRHDLSVIIAGYEDDIQKKLYAYNDGLRSRFIEVSFDDFDEADLLVIWNGLLEEREWTNDAMVATIACRRLARGAGRKGFGNARAARQLFERATAEAMAREDFNGETNIQAVDVIGERPTKNLKLQQTLVELDSKIGWQRIKERVRELVDLCDANYNRELNGVDVVPMMLNRLFLGNPGTGKTTCAAIYGRVLKHLGFLSNGDVVKKTASDFVGQYIGQGQTKTNAILDQAKGKVLIIDEAYNLNDSMFGKQVLDVLVEKVQGGDYDDMAVILVGYEHQMKEMLRTENPGLARRFPIEYAFYFDDYTDQELLDILSALCVRKNVYCPLDVTQSIIHKLSMQRDQANFGNAGAVEMMLKSAMANASKRPLDGTTIRIEMEDIESEVLQRSKSETCTETVEAKEDDPLDLLDRLYRMDGIRDELTRLRTRVKVAQEEGDETPDIGHFVFRGSPGTGKTTVARVMGKILFRMGLLGTDRVVETSGLNMTGEYVGQTKKKVTEQLGQARGGVLFIDEAYELGKGMYGEEAMTSLVAAMTDPTYRGMVIIIAGYPADLDDMLNRNAGLKSRFTRFLDFVDWTTDDCMVFTTQRCKSEGYRLDPDAKLLLTKCFAQLRQLEGFGNGRDVGKVWDYLLENRAQRVSECPELERVITMEDAEATSATMLTGRKPPFAKSLCRSTPTQGKVQSQDASASSSDQPSSDNKAKQEQPEKDDESDGDDEALAAFDRWSTIARDPNVSEAVWQELERAKQAYDQMLRDLKDAEDQRVRDEAKRKLEESIATQEKLRRIGLCPAGFAWLQVGGGWRCAGGSHFVSDAQLQRDFTY